MKQPSIVIVSDSRTVAHMLMSHIGGVDRDAISITGSKTELNYLLRVYRPRFMFIENCFEGRVTNALVHRLMERDPDLLISVFTIQEYAAYEVAKFMYWGAASFLSIRDDPEAIAAGMRKILKGESCYPDGAAEAVEHAENRAQLNTRSLTMREGEVLQLAADNKSNGEIAKVLGISVRTVRNHRDNILRKCEGHSLMDMVKFGLREGILQYDELVGEDRHSFKEGGVRRAGVC
ncbi:two component transcriptional regulator, LuxR family [Treponema primitia ZAS-2]|uniref:Two component transcriptional regulator, LuxR family n=1 Tax=Treponema primitia (strain ATCC BAA-887 / DSM 12427 / ZAS-2) TaxID=545694 RepID=F5YJQ6_TREPZ|nr:response regulator transcription factor [Treponema primitia]AEF84399.1 two component transcriptional regulator, LuxR family [Treponema primitia ZAS-2]